jgi:uncharacterized protein DUF4154
MVVAASPRRCPAQTGPTIDRRQEYNVKAVFLYSFGRYVDWPAETDEKIGRSFVIGILGEDPFGGALDKIAKTKQVENRPIVVRRWKSFEQYRPCHILFVPRTTLPEQQAAAIGNLATEHVLIVGETPGFAEQGGTLNFFIEGESVRFEINITAVRRQTLAVDGKLLRLATTVAGP